MSVSRDPDDYDKYRDGGRSDLSRRFAQRQIEQRRMWGDLAPGQRSLNEPWNRD